MSLQHRVSVFFFVVMYSSCWWSYIRSVFVFTASFFFVLWRLARKVSLLCFPLLLPLDDCGGITDYTFVLGGRFVAIMRVFVLKYCCFHWSVSVSTDRKMQLKQSIVECEVIKFCVQWYFSYPGWRHWRFQVFVTASVWSFVWMVKQRNARDFSVVYIRLHLNLLTVEWILILAKSGSR